MHNSQMCSPRKRRHLWQDSNLGARCVEQKERCNIPIIKIKVQSMNA